ncbi:MAG: histidinol phosphatase [Flavobacteriales bacterium]|nr:histidinol phosphatase [Flavobacteriales bacterium]
MGFLNNIFSKKPKLEPISLSVFGADIHSHLIPGIDDGAPDMEASINMIRRFKELGYKKVVTTPHVMCDYYKNTPEIILSGLDKVREELARQHIDFEISAAAEYNLDDGLAELIEKKQILTFGDNHVLFELPFMSEPPNFQEIVFNFQMAGYKPILAHPERYSYWYSDFDKYEELKARGVLLQMNLLSLTGHYSPQTKKIAEKMVDAGLIDAVGTDCHRIEHLTLLEQHLNLPHMHQLAAQEKLFNKTL